MNQNEDGLHRQRRIVAVDCSLLLLIFSIGYMIMKGYINVNISATFVLALIATIIHFSVKVWYRRKP